MTAQLIGAEAATTPRANEAGEAWRFQIGDRWTKASIRPALAPLKASNAAILTMDAQRSGQIPLTTSVPSDDVGARRIISPFEFRKPTFHQSRGKVTTLQRWEGNVVEVNDQSFIARLADRTGARVDEEGEFSLEEVSPADRNLVIPGAVFYWSIGYLDQRSGQRTRESVLRFRRLPAWNRRELDEARQRARKISARFGPSGSQRATY